MFICKIDTDHASVTVMHRSPKRAIELALSQSRRQRERSTRKVWIDFRKAGGESMFWGGSTASCVHDFCMPADMFARLLHWPCPLREGLMFSRLYPAA